MSNTSLATNDFTFLDRPSYFAKLTQLLNGCGAGDRALVASMGFEPTHPQLPALVDAFCTAAKNGATVSFIVDAYAITYANRYMLGAGSLLWRGLEPKLSGAEHTAITQALNRLRSSGVHVAVTNQPRKGLALPFVGRSHIKTAIVNNEVFVGGENLHRPDIADIMVQFNHQPTADWLYRTMQKLASTQQTQLAFGHNDMRHTIDSQTEVLLDAGARRQSVILDEAIAAISRAKEWIVLTCQFFPDTPTLLALKRAQERGVRVNILYNNPSKHEVYDVPLHYVSRERERLHMPKNFFQFELGRTVPFLHAKVLATDQEALVGSHNYVTAGVTFGTAEIALHRQGDVQWNKNAARFVANQVGLAADPHFSFLS